MLHQVRKQLTATSELTGSTLVDKVAIKSQQMVTYNVQLAIGSPPQPLDVIFDTGVCVYIYIYTYMQLYMYMYTHTHTHTLALTLTLDGILDTGSFMLAVFADPPPKGSLCRCVRVRVRVRVRVFVCVRVCVHIY
jgi:hypothetical protein